MSENNRRQAYLPAASTPILNPVGTAPGFIVEGSAPESHTATIIALPGVPREMEHLMQHAVLPYLRARLDQAAQGAVIKARTLHTVALGESWIDERIDDLMRESNPTVGLAAHFGIVDIRITARAASEPEADAMIATMESSVRGRLREGDVFGVDGETLEGVTAALLARAGVPLALVESNTAGDVARRLRGASAGSGPLTRSEEVDGPDSLCRLLDISPAKIETFKFASEMAAAAAAAALSDTYESGWGLAVLGDMQARDDVYGDETGNTYAALAGPQTTVVRHYPYGGQGDLTRHWVTVRVLDLLRRAALDRLSTK